MVKTLNLLLSYYCNYTCRHCISNCGPLRKERMAFPQAKDYIDSACSTGKIGGIGYTGGEPFWVEPLMVELMDYSYHTYGLSQGVVTNGFWAAEAAAALSTMKRLRRLGLRNLTLSCDTWHLQFAKVYHIRNAVLAALEYGLEVCINVTVTRSGDVAKQDILPLLNLDGETLEEKIVIKEFGPLMLGRAAKTMPREELIRSEDPVYFNAPCEYVMKVPTVTPNGASFACCCFGDAEIEPRAGIGYIGTSGTIPLGELLDRMEHNLLLNLLSRRGPYTVLEVVRSFFPEIRARRKFFGTCDVCMELFHNPEVREGLAVVLQNLAASPASRRRDCG